METSIIHFRNVNLDGGTVFLITKKMKMKKVKSVRMNWNSLSLL